MVLTRTDVITNFTAFDNLSDLVNAYPELVAGALEDALAVIEPTFLSELRHTPGPVKRPIEWTSERQRKAFFASNGFGHGIPYVRTGELADKWAIRLAVRRDGADVAVSNASPAAPYVVGPLRRNVISHQQQFHRNTGWLPAVDTIEFWTQALREETRRRLVKLLSNR